MVKWRQNPIFFLRSSVARLTGSPSAGYSNCPHVAVMVVAFKLNMVCSDLRQQKHFYHQCKQCHGVYTFPKDFYIFKAVRIKKVRIKNLVFHYEINQDLISKQLQTVAEFKYNIKTIRD